MDPYRKDAPLVGVFPVLYWGKTQWRVMAQKGYNWKQGEYDMREATSADTVPAISMTAELEQKTGFSLGGLIVVLASTAFLGLFIYGALRFALWAIYR